MADKGRAVIAGTAGDFNFDCPLDNYLFVKGVKGMKENLANVLGLTVGQVGV